MNVFCLLPYPAEFILEYLYKTDVSVQEFFWVKGLFDLIHKGNVLWWSVLEEKFPLAKSKTVLSRNKPA